MQVSHRSVRDGVAGTGWVGGAHGGLQFQRERGASPKFGLEESPV